MQTSFNVYYQVASDNNSKKLRQIFAEDVEDHIDAIQQVMHSLHKNMETFYKPVLAVINGGKL